MSFFDKIGRFFKKVFSTTSWEQTASATITVVAPLLETVVALVAGAPAEALVANVVSEIQSDLAASTVLIQDAALGNGTTSTKTAIQSILTAVQTNLKSLENMAEIKDAATQAKVTAAVSAIGAEITAILTAIP